MTLRVWTCGEGDHEGFWHRWWSCLVWFSVTFEEVSLSLWSNLVEAVDQSEWRGRAGHHAGMWRMNRKRTEHRTLGDAFEHRSRGGEGRCWWTIVCLHVSSVALPEVSSNCSKGFFSTWEVFFTSVEWWSCDCEFGLYKSNRFHLICLLLRFLKCTYLCRSWNINRVEKVICHSHGLVSTVWHWLCLLEQF